MRLMGIGTSIFLIAAGAILRYAVTATVSGVELQTVGLILMIVGIVGLVIALAVLFMADRRGPGAPDDYPPTRRL
jgi:beta-lactamase regulating signal transducer with metallopeptidase domain